MKYNNYTGEISSAVNDAVNKGYEVIDGFWNLLEHPDFPFVTLTSTTNGARNFPPYNIIETDDTTVRLDMAIAGYSKDRISVHKEGNVLIIQATEQQSKETVRHRGISNGRFTRTFEMQPNTQVSSVEMKDGILSVVVATVKPAASPRTTFEIK